MFKWLILIALLCVSCTASASDETLVRLCVFGNFAITPKKGKNEHGIYLDGNIHCIVGPKDAVENEGADYIMSIITTVL